MKYQKYNGDNMGLLVDTNKISSEIKNLDKYISDYNDNCADIYFELSKLNNYWKDNNTSVFNEKINQEKIKNLDTIEYQVQLKLKEFLESQGVNTLLFWNDIENFIEKKVTPIYMEEHNDEVDDLEAEISNLEDEVFEAESAFGSLRDDYSDHIKETSEDISNICKGLVEMEAILSSNNKSIKEIINQTKELQEKLKSKLKTVQDEEIW